MEIDFINTRACHLKLFISTICTILNIKNLFSDLNPIIIILNKKIDMDKLYDHLLDLDSDEGIRIENPKGEKRIYINRNLLGIYNIMVRTKKDKTDNKDKAKDYNNDILNEDYLEEIHTYDNSSHVLEFLKQNIDKPSIWLY